MSSHSPVLPDPVPDASHSSRVHKPAAVVLQIAGRPGPAFLLDPSSDNVLGRTTGSLVVLADRLASRNHAAIRFDPEATSWVLRDLGSRNGTWLDNVRVGDAILTDGSLIRVGTTELVFQVTATTAGLNATDDGPSASVPEHRVVRCGPPAELEGAALTRAGGDHDTRWPMLLYQAGIRLLAAASPRDVVCTTLEMAAEFTAAASFAWLEPADDGQPIPVCVVPPGSGLPARVAATAWREAAAGRGIWLADNESGQGDVACVPLQEDGRVRAVLAAAGNLREVDFDLLLTIASLAAAATASRGRRHLPQSDQESHPAATDPLDDAAIDGLSGEADRVDGTLALSTAELELIRGGSLAAELTTAASLRLEDWERLLALEALRRSGGSVPEAATLLGISRATLYRRLDAYGLTRDGSPPAEA